jgi:hypothetical protein
MCALGLNKQNWKGTELSTYMISTCSFNPPLKCNMEGEMLEKITKEEPITAIEEWK